MITATKISGPAIEGFSNNLTRLNLEASGFAFLFCKAVALSKGSSRAQQSFQREQKILRVEADPFQSIRQCLQRVQEETLSYKDMCLIRDWVHEIEIYIRLLLSLSESKDEKKSDQS